MSHARRMDMDGPEAEAFYQYMTAQPSIPQDEEAWGAATVTLNQRWPSCAGIASTWAHRYQILACAHRVDRRAYQDLARDIARCRTAYSWTQQDLARKIGIEVSRFSRLIHAQEEWAAADLTAVRGALPDVKVPRAIADAASWLDPTLKSAVVPVTITYGTAKQQTLPLTACDIKLHRIIDIFDLAIAQGTPLSVDRLRTLQLYLRDYDPTLAIIDEMRRTGEA